MGNEYARIHYAARKQIATQCKHCGSSIDLQAALCPNADPSHLKRDEMTGSWYSRDVNDYIALCIPCHRKQDLVDGRLRCKHGHPYTSDNTLIKPDGSRRCRTCHREQQSSRMANESTRAKKREANQDYRHSHPMTEMQKARKRELQRIRRNAAHFEFGEKGGRA